MKIVLPLALAGVMAGVVAGATAGVMASFMATAAAQPLHRAHRHLLRAGSTATRALRPGQTYGAGAGSFDAGAAQVPPPGFYNGYEGPGATVLRRGVAAQYEPGAAEEIAPGAKQTATGGPVGGLPGFGGGM